MDRPPFAKRPRLSMACNICRQRKVKCDAEYPKCQNCRVRNQECITTDPQRPGCPGFREWLQVPEKEKTQIEPPRRNQTANVGEYAEGEAEMDTARIFEYHNASMAAEDDGNEASPVRQPFETSVNTEQGTNRTKILGGSSSQCLAKSLDVYFKAARMEPVSGFFRHGMRRAEELNIPLALTLPELPDAERRKEYCSVFRLRIYPLYPIFNFTAFSASLEQLAAVEDLSTISRDDIPVLVSAYLLMSIGVDERAQYPTEEGERYLHAAAGLLAHVIVVPYLPTVQALLLFTVAYRGRNQEGLAWQTLGIAIRIAYTLGLHRSQKQTTDEVHTRIWATCCSLEKVMHLASGWPTLIPDDLMADPDSLRLNHRFLQWHLALAHYQGSISRHLYSHRPTDRAGAEGTTKRTVRQILLDTARLDNCLQSWANKIPSDQRPGSDLLTSSADFHILAFLSIEYHGSMIALHRAALIAPRSKIEEEVKRHCSGEDFSHRLTHGESICANSARIIARLSIELQDYGADSALIPAGTAGLACIALAIWLMKHPSSRLRETDLALLKGCVVYCSMRFKQCGFDQRYTEGLGLIYEQVRGKLDGFTAATGPGNATTTKSRAEYHSHVNGKPDAPGFASGHLPTPLTSSHGPATPTPHGQTHQYRQVCGVTSTISQRTSSGSSASITHLPVHEQQNGNGGFPDIPEPNMGDQSSGFTESFPFEGFNVEELWNWMLYFDSPPRTDML
ncbi:hypothetical protein AN8473.2 [Aspergillus nidulans FGSC A4]|uniref:Zn(II)2Cys6 transcription factor (Eurofung) n=1 Tax=Emericella nidulans (strain FGSC A4 / ATCC 38163 / CBS 112.46 / NRRL 194 / M139) TaxID=227321 RepID=Q5ATA7_EMENI|nr:hypothetical protein [Aspergillus nidulans FGSC A4]EAA67095.1 hypothetical protein AN8473.2 [Aspergillus nidulans FGSC A4]CBF80622.1 TPA: Putative Zn(II)2Cys6 transcription factor (Eurofung) [Aspergillus nidulans FGSC A4]|eukprot:XP_681742.1 hypothetical protein AN8473.2 [Aspergillus nidulans FGSC A4]